MEKSPSFTFRRPNATASTDARQGTSLRPHGDEPNLDRQPAVLDLFRVAIGCGSKQFPGGVTIEGFAAIDCTITRHARWLGQPIYVVGKAVLHGARCARASSVFIQG